MDTAALEGFFAPGGALEQALGSYEQRREQVDVALRVAAAIDSQGQLVAEAGTGVGKTLAYLVPAIMSGQRIVVSTGTKTLQDQIINGDLPLIERALGKEVVVQVMKGRTNYLCHLRADRVAAQPELPGLGASSTLAEILAWRDRTQTGDRAELAGLPDDSPLWRELTATSEQCVGRACKDFERCWVTVMRQQAQTAQLVIVNHYLYFADVALRSRLPDAGIALLPAHDLVVFDEAHDLDEIAAQHFGCQVSDRRIQDLSQDIERLAANTPPMVAQLKPALQALSRNSSRLFELLPFDGGRKALSASALHPAVTDTYREVGEQLAFLEGAVATWDAEETRALSRRARELAAELAFILELPDQPSLTAEAAPSPETPETPYVRYTERSGRARALVARPVMVADLLQQYFDELPAIFVSATLAVGGDLSHFRARLGLLRAKELLVGSPFDFETNARLYLPQDLPLPADDDFAPAAAGRAAQLVAASGGGAFVLCTSYRNLPLMRAAIERETNLPVLMQGEAPRSQLIHAFRTDGHAILVATMSFWQGVDVPGAALRLVVIDKLPFAWPGDPLTAARLEHMRTRGGDPFREYQIPHAALLLRQGFGRLIRRQTDRGMVAILDRRILTHNYGKVFLRSLPSCPQLHDAREAVEFLSSLAEPAC